LYKFYTGCADDAARRLLRHSFVACKFNYSIAPMKNDKKNIKEPYEPNDTPKPPQVIEPNSGRERENPVTEDERTEASGRNEKRNNPDAAHSEKQHLLADDAEIDDETTI